MKKIFWILTLIIIILISSCEKDKSNSINSNFKTSFNIGSAHYESNYTKFYQTDFGQILKITGESFALYFVMSDTINNIYSVTDTLKGTDNAKVKSILQLGNEIKFSSSGTFEFDKSTKSGVFTIETEGLKIKNGLIKVDTIIKKPIVDFTTLSETDFQGAPMNEGDDNDWIFRSNFDVVERIIFNLKDINPLYSSIHLIEYPNPFSDMIQLHLAISVESKVDLFLVNENLEIEQKFIGLQSGRWSLLLDNLNFKGNYYRLYYKLYTGKENFYGSGDLKAKF